ncbi:MAG: LuxR C-terminal-related transcriptional regulator [Acidobacteriaceae bacterium]
MADVNPTSLHAVVPANSAGADRRAVVRLPESRICVHAIGLDPLRAAGLQALFETNTGIDIVIGSIDSLPGNEARTPSRLHMVLIGVHAGPDISQAIASIRQAHPNFPIVVMSHASGHEAIFRVLMQGAKGFLHEACTPVQFEKAIRLIASGSIWAPRRVQAELIGWLLTAFEAQRAGAIAGVSFTAREQQVLDLLLDGGSNREIARSLKIEERTVKSYVTRLMQKVGVKNRTALTMRAQELTLAIQSAAQAPLAVGIEVATLDGAGKMDATQKPNFNLT